MSSLLPVGRYFGAVSGAASGSVFSARRIVHPGARRLPTHGHAPAYFCLLAGGHYRERNGDRELVYRPFDCVYHPPGTVHQDEVGRLGAIFFSLEVAPRDALDREAIDAVVGRSALRVLDAAGVALAARAYGQHTSGALSQLSLESYGWELLGAGLAPATAETGFPRWLRRAIEMLHASIEDGVSVSELARAVDVHPGHLARTFRQRVGRTAGGYLEQLRVEAACRLLAGDASLAEIAARTGFADQSHFTRTFKRLVGVPPGRYRSLMR